MMNRIPPGMNLCPSCSEIEEKPVRITPTGKKHYTLITWEEKQCPTCELKIEDEVARRALTPDEIAKLGLEG